MPYRIDVSTPPPDALDRLVELGALDVERVADGIAAILPDSVGVATVEAALRHEVRVTPARGRDGGSVWVIHPPTVRIRGLQIVPADRPAQDGALRLIDDLAFGTGLHATTALCLESLHDEVTVSRPASVLDIGTGSGVLALAALFTGVTRATGIDIDRAAVRVAAANARLNGLHSRFSIVCGGPTALSGVWPLVVANVLASPLIDMAPTLARRVDRGGRIILSGIRTSLASDVVRAYRHVGMQLLRENRREGWSALTFLASW